MMKKNKDVIKIIFILADTLRAKNVGLYGKKPSPTPNIDSLGKSGVVFTNAYATTTSTDPSITAIMSGKYPLSTGLINHGMWVKETEEKNLSKTNFLPEILSKNKFKTFAIDWLSRWHKRGYDYYSGKISKNTDPEVAFGKGLHLPIFFRAFDKLTLKFLNRMFFIRFYYSFFPDPKIPYDTADVITNKAIEILQRKKAEKLFLYLHFWDAHWPHTRPRSVKSCLLDNAEKTYDAEISFLDKEIGRLIDYLKKTNQIENTLIIFTGDHGESFIHDLPLHHENLYEDVVKVPLIFRHKSLKPQKINALAQHVDILPTILDILGIPIPKDVDGESLMPLALRKKQKIRDFAYFEDVVYRKIDLMKIARRRGIRMGDYKYIETLSGKKEDLYSIMPREGTLISKRELYDLKNDPLEKKNLIDEKSKTAGELEDQLRKLIYGLNCKRLNSFLILKKKVEKSKKIIRTIMAKYKPKDVAIAWKGGKDTTVLMHILKTINGGKIPFKVFFNDTTMEFKETYEFINKMKQLWNLDLITIRHSDKELKEFHSSKNEEGKKEMARLMKITAIKKALAKYKLKGFLVGIRRDENKARGEEKYFSKREDHIRLHPILDFTEDDIWNYNRIFGVPNSKLYDEGYRSVGEQPFTSISKSDSGERSGRDQEKEKTMGRLRKLGYW